MAEKKTKAASTGHSSDEKLTKKKKSKEKELITLDETVLFLGQELFKKTCIIDLEINQHYNKKAIIFSESDLNSSLNISLKLSEFKEVKNLDFRLLDNDEIELDIDIEKYSSSAKLKRTAKIEKAVLNSQEGCFSFSLVQENNRVEEIVCKIFSLLTNYILKHIFVQDFVKNFHAEKSVCENNLYENDLKNGSLSHLYNKSVNQLFNTKVPYFGDKMISDMIEIEGIMSEKGQLWVYFVFKIL